MGTLIISLFGRQSTYPLVEVMGNELPHYINNVLAASHVYMSLGSGPECHSTFFPYRTVTLFDAV